MHKELNEIPRQQSWMTDNQPSTSSSGTLRTKLTMKGVNGGSCVASSVQSMHIPFHCMEADLPGPSAGINRGSVNLLKRHDVMPNAREVIKPDLCSYLSNLPGRMPDMTTADAHASSLRALIDKPPITTKQLIPLTTGMLQSFTLTSTPLPERYQSYVTMVTGDGDWLKTDPGAVDRSKRVYHEVKREYPENEPKSKRRREEDEKKERKKKKKEKKKKKNKGND